MLWASLRLWFTSLAFYATQRTFHQVVASLTMPDLFLSNKRNVYKLKWFWLTESYSEGYWKKYTDWLSSDMWCSIIYYQQPIIVNTITLLPDKTLLKLCKMHPTILLYTENTLKKKKKALEEMSTLIKFFPFLTPQLLDWFCHHDGQIGPLLKF